ncbi:hypothetical protein HPP92_016549 [Vanilla planifolia]|uniref:Uncharacterized protein n=1 Tax=Vanilla planifolia TaxID=51239 RepID=A0A835QCF6_VANPL|nr:hypothetical protein HPP92_016549 [Vanilla planifolia]
MMVRIASSPLLHLSSSDATAGFRFLEELTEPEIRLGRFDGETDPPAPSAVVSLIKREACSLAHCAVRAPPWSRILLTSRRLIGPQI